jgi:serine/threonine protein kinase
MTYNGTECQASDATREGLYSPRSCDIWSLGIVLLNIVTGRSPWKSATHDDPTFRSYYRNPYYFLPKILPISPELNDVLVMILTVEWRARPSIPEIRAAIKEVATFYSADAIFEGNIARCAWETGLDLGTGTHKPNIKVKIASPPKYRQTRNNVSSRPPSTFEDEEFFEGPLCESPRSATGEDDSSLPQYASYPIHSAPASPSTSSLCTSDPASPITPANATSSIEQHLGSRPRSPFTSLISGLRCFLRLYSSQSSSVHADKDLLTSDPEMFSIDL